MACMEKRIYNRGLGRLSMHEGSSELLQEWLNEKDSGCEMEDAAINS
jgi:hypothetical protein